MHRIHTIGEQLVALNSYHFRSNVNMVGLSLQYETSTPILDERIKQLKCYDFAFDKVSKT